MSTNKNFDRICVIVLFFTLLLTVLFMNGEALGIRAVQDQDAETYTGTDYFTKNDLNGDWDASGAAVITLEGDTASITGNGAYVLDGSVYIVQSGTYRISGTLTNGSVIVDAAKSSKVWILLEGVDIHCEDDACFRVDEADKVFLTLAEGSINSLSGGAAYSEKALEDGTSGVIYAHDDLTINGSGSLTITAAYRHGITAKDDLVITGGTLRITAAEDGIHTNDSFRSTGADIVISAGDDGITTDGYVYVESGTIRIEQCYEGIEGRTIDIAGGEITIYPTDDGINATDGSSSEYGDWLLPGGETQDSAQGSEDEIYIRISGGSVTIVNESGIDADGLDSNGNLYITGGTVRISLVGGGSNNAIDVGTESGGAAYISGGTVIAAGGSAMAELFDDSSGQPSIMLTVSADEPGTTASLSDADGKLLLTWDVPCSFTSVIFSCPELTEGETYTVTAGEVSEEVTLTGTTAYAGSGQTGMDGGMGGFPAMGEFPGEGERPAMEDFPAEGEQPAKGEFPGENRPEMEEGQFPGPQQNAEGSADSAGEESVSTETKLLLAGSSAVILLLGIVIAVRSRSFSV